MAHQAHLARQAVRLCEITRTGRPRTRTSRCRVAPPSGRSGPIRSVTPDKWPRLAASGAGAAPGVGAWAGAWAGNGSRGPLRAGATKVLVRLMAQHSRFAGSEALA